jgi:hypothetical protein
MHLMMDDIQEYGLLNYKAGFVAGLLSGVFGTNIFIYLTRAH